MLTVGVDSYVTRAECDAYWELHGEPVEWDQATLEDKEAALRYACAWLDARYDWIGIPASLTQTLSWPRLAAWDWEGRYVGTDPTNSTPTTPQMVKDAQCEAALSHIRDKPLGQVVKSSQSSVTSVQAGTVRVTYGADGGYVPPSYSYIDSILSRVTVHGGATSMGILRS